MKALLTFKRRLAALASKYRSSVDQAEAHAAVLEYAKVYEQALAVESWHGEPEADSLLPDEVMPPRFHVLRSQRGAAHTQAPGSWRPVVDLWASFDASAIPAGAIVIVDALVLRLHKKTLRLRKDHRVIALTAGEGAKTLATVEKLAAATIDAARTATVVAIGGGTIGDVATVFAHLLKRGVELIHVPTTLLAAVDSSVGGKGAVNVDLVKNALGVFHCPAECWVCPELFTTLSGAQRREGRLEAYKMALGNEVVWQRWLRSPPDDEALIRESRELKARICAQDPYERTGQRTVLNFGHTFGHVIEAVTRHRVRHGEAVGLGMLCALDVGVALGVTPADVAATVEAALPNAPNSRARLAKVLKGQTVQRVAALLAGDKKGFEPRGGAVRMVLLQRPGTWVIRSVPAKVWAQCLRTRWSASPPRSSR